MKIFFVTLGCKVNQYESEAMRKLFEAAGYTAAEEISAADVVAQRMPTKIITSLRSEAA
ncbi:MAG: hypothetical protein SR1Q7_01625 [Quinella sp. 1Q7]|nr:hypothetical protein [Quinella sp. 1Q7]